MSMQKTFQMLASTHRFAVAVAAVSVGVGVAQGALVITSDVDSRGALIFGAGISVVQGLAIVMLILSMERTVRRALGVTRQLMSANVALMRSVSSTTGIDLTEFTDQAV